jgi:hypothetical protein
MSSYEERMENLKEEKIAQILKAYKVERPLSVELKAEIDAFYGAIGYGCWFVDWLNSRIWCWLMVEWAKNDEEEKERIHWEDIQSDDEEEEEWYGGCPECGEPQDKPFEGMCSGCVIRRNAEFAEIRNSEFAEMVEEERLTEQRYKVGYEDADPEDDTFETIEEARPLYDRLIATGRYGWVQINCGMDTIEEWENPNNCGACGFLDCECSEESDSDCECAECKVQQ